MGFCQNIPTWFWASFFQNLNFFHFSWHIFDCCVVWSQCFLLTQRSRLGGLFRYLVHVRKVDETFLGALEKNFSTKIEKEIFGLYFELHFLIIFWAESFFHRTLTVKIFSWLYEHVQGIWKVRLTLIFASVKTIMTIWLTNRIICQEKWKKLRFWKNEAQNQVGIFWQNFFGGDWNFFFKDL